MTEKNVGETPVALPPPNIPLRLSFFTDLYRKFTQINTHLTFLSSFSRHTIHTADHLRKLNADISDLDLEMIKELLPPGDVSFGYFDENQLLLQHLEKVQYSHQKGFTHSQPKTVDDAYEALSKDASCVGHERQLLVFEFCDVRTKGIGAAIKGKTWPGARKRQKREPSPGPEFFSLSEKMSFGSLSQEQLQAIIRGRNERFHACIEGYLEAFSKEEVSEGIPFKMLVETCSVSVPEPAILADPVTIMETATNAEQHCPSDSLEKPTVEEMLLALEKRPLYRNQIRRVHTLTEPRHARLEPVETGLIHADLADALWLYKRVDACAVGLYAHQTQALAAIINERKHVIVSTPTSSGKSLVYQLPILNEILRDGDAHTNSNQRTTTALLIFPTKALAQDQMRHLKEFISHLPQKNRKIVVDTYDGDTPAESRQHIRNFSDIIFTNPDAIHASILPGQSSEVSLEYGQNRGWLDFLSKLKYVIMDELHVYRGTFGTHVSYVMARLNRLRASITKYPDSVPVYISCSATIGNPETHFRTLCALPPSDAVVHVFEDGSPATEKQMIVWEPPILMNKKGQRELSQTLLKSATSLKTPIQSPFLPRENIVSELSRILVHLLNTLPSIKAIVFCTIRAVCELLIKEVKTLISDQKHPEWCLLSEHDVMAYRGGYSKSDRRAIEQKMFLGQLRAIVATNALELGIDLSDLDVVISCGFPVLKLNLHQQFGRAGRGKTSKGSVAILVCGSSPVERYYLQNSHELCAKTYEDLCIDGFLDGSLHITAMAMHLQCAAFEWPLHIENDAKWFCRGHTPQSRRAFHQVLTQNLYRDKNGVFRTNPRYLPWPAEKVPLRAIEQTLYAVVDITHNRNVVIEEVEELRTSFTLYEGGIFLHQGLPYLVKDFNTAERYAKVERVKVTWTTLQRDFSDVDPLEIELVKKLNAPLVGPSKELSTDSSGNESTSKDTPIDRSKGASKNRSKDTSNDTSKDTPTDSSPVPPQDTSTDPHTYLSRGTPEDSSKDKSTDTSTDTCTDSCTDSSTKSSNDTCTDSSTFKDLSTYASKDRSEDSSKDSSENSCIDTFTASSTDSLNDASKYVSADSSKDSITTSSKDSLKDSLSDTSEDSFKGTAKDRSKGRSTDRSKDGSKDSSADTASRSPTVSSKDTSTDTSRASLKGASKGSFNDAPTDTPKDSPRDPFTDKATSMQTRTDSFQDTSTTSFTHTCIDSSTDTSTDTCTDPSKDTSTYSPIHSPKDTSTSSLTASPRDPPTDIPVFYGKVQTTIIVFGYFKVNRKGEILEAVEVDNPPVILRSKGFWIDIPTKAIAAIKRKSLNPAGGIHAAQHAIMNVLPLFITGGATTNPNARFTPNNGADCELSTECKAPQKEFSRRQSLRKRPARLIFHDSKGGEQGTGMAAKTFEYIGKIVGATYDRVRNCECTWGCPLCVAGTFCKENMLVMSKPGAILILGALLGVDLEELKRALPDGPEPNMPVVETETIADLVGGESRNVVRFSPDVKIVG